MSKSVFRTGASGSAGSVQSAPSTIPAHIAEAVVKAVQEAVAAELSALGLGETATETVVNSGREFYAAPNVLLPDKVATQSKPVLNVFGIAKTPAVLLPDRK